MTKKEAHAKSKEIIEAMKLFPKDVSLQEKAYRAERKVQREFAKFNLPPNLQVVVAGKVHPWRVCSLNHYYRSKHAHRAYVKKSGVRVRASEHPAECVLNRTGKDQLYPDEIQKIAELHFDHLVNLPTDNILEKYKEEASFDRYIAGWSQYWNEVFQTSTPLESNFVKALIASESGFDTDAWNGRKGKKSARGLMQVTNETVALLAWRSRELKDHFVNLNESDMLNANFAICAGIRWLFRKREIAESRSKNVNWSQVVMLYKNYGSLADPEMKRFLAFYEALKTKDKSKLPKK